MREDVAKPPGRRFPGVLASLAIAGCWAVFVVSAMAAGHAQKSFPTAWLLLGLVTFSGGLYLLWRSTEGSGSSRAGLAGVCLAIGVGAVFLGVVVTAQHDDGTRSARVQAHGTRVQGTVVDVKATTEVGQTRYDLGRVTVTSTELIVQLDQPVKDVSVTHVRRAGPIYVDKGKRLEVVVDPDDPSYAELPGQPAHSSGAWRFLLAGAVAAWVVLVVAVLIPRRRSGGSSRS